MPELPDEPQSTEGLFIFADEGQLWSVRQVRRWITAWSLDEVVPALEEWERETEEGSFGAAAVAYGAAPAFDSALKAKHPEGMPYAIFAVYEDQPTELKAPIVSRVRTHWEAECSEVEYADMFGRVKDYLELGDSYQVNLTFQLLAAPKDLLPRFFEWHSEGFVPYASFWDTPTLKFASLSPELFFQYEKGVLTCRPMKGTDERMFSDFDTIRNARNLRESPKERAENLMIVDMIRNDLGKICEEGSVKVQSLFDIELYPSVVQMTSTVTGISSAALSKVFEALFPCASIVGAPKVRTSEIIEELEKSPRGFYTGAIGFKRGSKTQFSVAIRTAAEFSSEWRYGIGSGVVWDSELKHELLECYVKKLAVSTSLEPDTGFIETLRWSDQEGFVRLDRHLNRLRRSTSSEIDKTYILTELEKLPLENNQTARIKIIFSKGTFVFTMEPLKVWSEPLKFVIDNLPTKEFPPSGIKSFDRDPYLRARLRHLDADEVLLWNPCRELTEFAMGNLVLEIDGELLTPPLSAGIVAGVFREVLLEKGEIKEQKLTLDDLPRASKIWFINSLREWVECELMEDSRLDFLPPDPPHQPR